MDHSHAWTSIAAATVDLMVVGDPTFAEIVAAINPAEKTLAREINPTVYSLDEFRSRLAAENHFLKAVLRGKKIFLIGDQHQLTNVASQPFSDGPTSSQAKRLTNRSLQ